MKNMDKQKSLKISILGKNYLINTDENQEDVFAAAGLVDSMIREQASKVAAGDECKVAVIIALQLATDLTKALNRLSGLENKVEQLNDLINTKIH